LADDPTVTSRRGLLAAGAAGALAFGAVPAAAQSAALLIPNAPEDQSAALQSLIDQSALADAIVTLPAGSFRVSGLILPRRVRLAGVHGATRLVYSGAGFLMTGDELDHVDLSGITFDGDGLEIGSVTRALLRLNGVSSLSISRCGFIGSSANGLWLERAAGSVEACTITDCAGAGLFATDSMGLSISGNTVSDCGDNGILVFRSAPGEDGTIVSRNRVARIDARSGGTGQYGNGINVFRAGNVSVTDNQISDCRFSAVRGNGAGNIRIADNSCLRLGETAIFSEFEFQGAVISGNVIDDAGHGINAVNLDVGGRLASITGNLVRNLRPDAAYLPGEGGFGTGISVEAEAAVSGNVIENAPMAGISIGWGPYMRNVSVTGNVVRAAPKGIIVSVVEGAGSAVISGNLLAETPDGAIVAQRWHEVASGDLIDGDDGRFPGLTIIGNRAA
jgi:uncharacterized secreted repeat protein (TIGR03808 family)